MNPHSAGNIFPSPVKSSFMLSGQVGMPCWHQCSAPKEEAMFKPSLSLGPGWTAWLSLAHQDGRNLA